MTMQHDLSQAIMHLAGQWVNGRVEPVDPTRPPITPQASDALTAHYEWAERSRDQQTSREQTEVT